MKIYLICSKWIILYYLLLKSNLNLLHLQFQLHSIENIVLSVSNPQSCKSLCTTLAPNLVLLLQIYPKILYVIS